MGVYTFGSHPHKRTPPGAHRPRHRVTYTDTTEDTTTETDARMHRWRRTPPTCRGDHVEVGKFALVAGLTEEVSVVVGQGHRLERLVALGTLEARLVPLPTSSEDLFVHVDRLVTASAFGSTTVAHSSSLLCTSFTTQDNADRVFSPRTRFVLREGKLPCPTKSLKKFVHWPAPLYRSPDPLTCLHFVDDVTGRQEGGLVDNYAFTSLINCHPQIR